MHNKNHILILLLIGFIISISSAYLMSVPGFMDAEYYFSGGVRLASGYGFSENFIWNYLDNPSSLPHPAFTYWMPLASLLAALGMWLNGSLDFLSARLFFICIAALIPSATYFTSISFSNNSRKALLSGLLAAFPAFYAIYLTNTETFSLYILLGWLFIALAFYSGKHPVFSGWKKYFCLGLISGFLHLTRADGVLWFLAAFVISCCQGLASSRNLQNRSLKKNSFAIALLCILAGYLFVMYPWYERNWSLFGTLFPPGNSRTIWLTNYDQTYIYPAAKLSFHNWINSGFNNLLSARWAALTTNLQTLIAVQGEIFLSPLILLGLWKYRRDNRVRFLLVMWGAILFIMTFVFPFAGPRGGFLHSGSALQIYFWILASEGLECFINFGVSKRGWNPKQSWSVFSTFLIILSISLTFFLYSQRVIGANPRSPIWNNSWENNKSIENAINGFNPPPGSIIMINNPPGYYAATLKPAVVIPDGGPSELIQVAKIFQAGYIVLEKNHPKGLSNLYNNPGSSPELEYLDSINEAKIYQLKLSP